jgi:hypothetical protein
MQLPTGALLRYFVKGGLLRRTLRDSGATVRSDDQGQKTTAVFATT